MDDPLVIIFAVIGSVLVMVISCVGGNIILSLCCRGPHSENTSNASGDIEDYTGNNHKKIPLVDLHIDQPHKAHTVLT